MCLCDVYVSAYLSACRPRPWVKISMFVWIPFCPFYLRVCVCSLSECLCLSVYLNMGVTLSVLVSVSNECTCECLNVRNTSVYVCV